MNKPILFAMLAVMGSLIVVSDVEARCCRRRRCCQVTTCGCSAAPAACNSGCCTAQSTNAMAPTVADTGSGSNSYQSYSYEPGANQAMTVQTSARNNARVWSEYDNVLRGNRKVVNTPY